MSPDGFGPAPVFVEREARAAGVIAPGTYRVIAYDRAITHKDFATIDEARRYADDVASEGDYEDIPPAAWIVDSRFECVDRGIHHGIRRPGKTAWESQQENRARG